VSALVLKDSCILGSFVQGSSRSNVAILGVAFVQNMYGAAGAAAIMVGIVVPLANVCSVLLLSVCGPRDTGASGKQQLATALRNVCKNPLILSILLGMAVSFSGFQLPPIVAKTVGSVAALATPLSLIVLGAGFGGREALKKWKPTAAASAIKLLALPALLLPMALLLGFRGQELASLVIMTGAPTAVSSYIMAQNMHNDAELASSIVAATTLLSSATLTFWIFLLKSLSFL
ncbi:MAG: AEC family transporter, partial [Pygmaiobacter sp.]